MGFMRIKNEKTTATDYVQNYCDSDQPKWGRGDDGIKAQSEMMQSTQQR